MSEQLTLQVLKTSTDKKYLSKSVNEITEKKCRLKEGSSIVNPVVILKNWDVSKVVIFTVFIPLFLFLFIYN